MRPVLAAVVTYCAFAAAPSVRAEAPPVPGIGANDVPLPARQPTDTWTVKEFNASWANAMIGQQEALRLGITGKSVLVGVFDNGMAAAYDENGKLAWIDPEIAGRLSPLSRYFASPAPDYRTLSPSLSLSALVPHGAHVMGIVGAAANGIGMMGIAPGANLIGLRTIMDAIQPVDNFAQASSWGLAAGARIFNASLGPEIPEGGKTWNVSNDQLYQLVGIRRMLDAGAILVVAAGNDGGFAPASANPVGLGLVPFIRPENNFDPSKTADPTKGVNTYDFSGTLADLLAVAPNDAARAELLRGTNFSDYASLPGRVISVVNINRDGTLWRSSNQCGVIMDWCVAAPGVDMLSTVNPFLDEDAFGNIIVEGSKFQKMTGTSMASPVVAGALADLAEAYPGYSSVQLVNLLFDTTQDLGAPGVDPVFGHGLIRLDWALQGPLGLNPSSTATYTVDLAADQRWRMSVTSAGGIVKTGTATLTLDASRSYAFGGASAVNGGSLIVNGTFSAPQLLVGPGATLGGGGVITASTTVNGTLAPGNSPGLLTFAAPLTLGPAALVRIEVDGPAAITGAGGFDRIAVVGAGNTFTANGTIAPVTRGISAPANNTYTPAIGTVLRIVTADAGVTGSFTALSQPLTGLPAASRFDVIYRSNAIDLAVTPTSFAAFAVNSNEAGAAAALDALRPAAGVRPDAPVKSTYDALYNGAAVAPVLETLSGLNRARGIDAALYSVAGWSDLVHDHADRDGAWAAAGGEWGHRDTRDGIAGNGTRRDVFGGGIGYRDRTGLLAGLAIGSADGADTASGLTQASTTATLVNGYAGYADATWSATGYVGYVAGAGRTRYDLTALSGGIGSFSGDFRGVFGGAQLKARLNRFRDGLSAFARFDAVSLGFDAVASGPAGFGLSSPSQTAARETVRLGFGYEHRFALDNGFLEPVAKIAWANDLVRDDRAAVAFGASVFQTHLPRVGRDAVEASLGLRAGFGPSLEAMVGANASARSGAWDAGGMASLTWHL